MNNLYCHNDVEHYTTEELEHYFDDYINEAHPMVEIMGMNYCPAYVFHCTDRHAYSFAFRTWAHECGYACPSGGAGVIQ
jgi:hypothetical protein